MGQAHKISQALVICTHENTRQIASLLIEESGFDVVEAQSMQDGASLLMDHARDLSFVFAEAADPDEARMLTMLIADNWPWIRVLVSIDPHALTVTDLPDGAKVLRRPWRPLDLLIEAERAAK